MDKYELNIKLEQIKKLVGKKDYTTAAKIAKEMDWRKVKDWTTLALIINVQEAAGDYEEARDTAILAYNRNLGGRRLVYKLTQLFIKMHEFEDAEDLYKEYIKMSQHDVNRYILLYELRKAQNAAPREQITILEEYKEHEIDERYLFELAELYSRANRIEDCIKECDEIILWFQDGIYVENAIRLKQQYTSITASQQKILDEADKEKEGLDLDKTQEMQFAEAKEKARIQEDEIEEAFREQTNNAEQTEESDAQAAEETESVVAHDQQETSFEQAEEEESEEEDAREDGTESKGIIKSLFRKAFGASDEEKAVEEKADEETDGTQETAEVQDDQVVESAAKDSQEVAEKKDDIDTVMPTLSAEDSENDAVADNQDDTQDAKEDSDSGSVTFTIAPDKYKSSKHDKNARVLAKSPDEIFPENDDIQKAGQSIKELIANARKKIEDNYEEAKRENAEQGRMIEEQNNRLIVESERDAQLLAFKKERGMIEEARNEEEAKLAENISVPVEDYSNMYNTQNIQKEIARNLDQLMRENPDDAELFRTMAATAPTDITDSDEELEEDEQIEGQLSLDDWMQEIKHEKYGMQETKEFSMAELEKELEEREAQRQNYERLLEKQRELAKQKGEPFNEEEARRKAEEENNVQSAKTDLAIRTGKATAKTEAEVEDAREAAKLTAQIEERAAREAERIEREVREESKALEIEKQVQNELEQNVEDLVDTHTDEVEAQTDAQVETQNSENEQADAEIPAADDKKEQPELEAAMTDVSPENAPEQEHENEATVETESSDQAEQEEITAPDAENTAEADDNTTLDEESEEEQLLDEDDYIDNSDSSEEAADQQIPEEDKVKAAPRHFSFFGKSAKNRKKELEEVTPEELEQEAMEEAQEIPSSVRKYFKKYSDMSGLEEQLAQYFTTSKSENGMLTSRTGNIIISGNRSSDKTNLAVSIIKALNALYPENARKIAKTTGESINAKGIAKAMPKLKGTALIVEDAGAIQPKRINEMLKQMSQDTEGMLVIFEDADTEINVLISVNPTLTKAFNHRITLKQYTVNELVEMAKKYAEKRQHAIDDDALLQLYLKIDRLHSQVDCVHLDQIKEIIDKAIVKAEKRASRKLFGSIKKKRGDRGDIYFLTEADFKD